MAKGKLNGHKLCFKVKSITDSEICLCRSVNFNGVSKIAQSSENYDLYMVGKLQMSSFQSFLQLVNSYFLEEVMAVLVHWGQVCRESVLCQRSPKSTQLWRNQVGTNWECFGRPSIYTLCIRRPGVTTLFSTISFLTGFLLSFRFCNLASSCRAILHLLPWSTSCVAALDLLWTLGRDQGLFIPPSSHVFSQFWLSCS